MSLEKTAFQSIDALLEELTVGIVAKEQEILRIQPRGGITMARLIEEYENRLKTLADHCAAQRSWVNKNSVFPSWASGARWRTKSNKSLEQLYTTFRGRIQGISNQTGVSNSAMVDQCQSMLGDRYEIIQKKLTLNLQAQFDESVNATAKQGLTAVQKYLVPLVTAALGALGAFLFSHFIS